MTLAVLLVSLITIAAAGAAVWMLYVGHREIREIEAFTAKNFPWRKNFPNDL